MTDCPADPNSGAAGTVYRTAEALKRLGHEVETVWADELGRRIRHGNLHYLLELPLAIRRVLRRKLGKRRYDVVEVSQPHGYLAAAMLRRSALDSVYIHRSHGFELRVGRDLAEWREVYRTPAATSIRQLLSPLMSRALYLNSHAIVRFADGHIVSATECADFLREEMGVATDRIAVVPQAVPDSFLEAGVPMDANRLTGVLYVGQFAFIKAPMIVAEVMNRLSEQRPDLRFTWVADASHHGEIGKLLETRTRERTRLMGWMRQEELIRVFDSHGIFVFPSFFEGFGKAFLEAMSRGLCVVAANNGGAHDVIRDGVDGHLVRTGGAKEMVDTCLSLLQDPQRAARMSRAATESARSYTWRRVAEESASFYRRRLEARAGARS